MKPTIEFGWIIATQNAAEAHRELAHDKEAWGDFFKAATLAVSDSVTIGVGLMQREAATIGEICQPVAGSTARLSTTGLLHCCCGCALPRLLARHVDNRRSRLEKLPV